MVDAEKIPLRGATPDQIALLAERLNALFPKPVMHETPDSVHNPAPENGGYFDADRYLERLRMLGEIVWYWGEKKRAFAAIVTFVHTEQYGGGLDLAVFSPLGGMEVQLKVPRRRAKHGWTPRGELA